MARQAFIQQKKMQFAECLHRCNNVTNSVLQLATEALSSEDIKSYQ